MLYDGCGDLAPEGQQVAPEILIAHTAWIKGSKEIVGLMLMTMEPEIQRNLENLHEFDSFVQNYNMHSLGKIINELHVVLKLHAQTLPKNNAPVLHAIRAGKVQKVNKHKKPKPQMAARGQNHGIGKNKLTYALKPKIPHPPKREDPAKHSICHECGIFTIELNTFLNKSWIYDTGCGTHICNTTQGLKASRKLKSGALNLYMGNGQREVVEAIGVFYLCLPSGLEIVLNNCHYAPSITRGVISVSCFAIPKDGIFEIDLSNSYANDSSMYAISNKRAKLDLDSALLWHCRLGHISKKRIEKLQHDGLLNSTDLGLLRNASLHKHEMFETFKVFQKKVENQLGKTIKSLRSNRGGEYMSQEFLDHLKDHGIITHRTPSYTPQHNGVSKKRNRTLLYMIRSMMSQTTLPKSFWDYTLETTVRILNMVLTKKVEKTPYERDTLTKPDKLEPMSIKCIFIGHPKETMGYSFYYPPENKVLVARNAKFLENSLITQEASGSLEDLKIIQEEDTHPSIDTSLNHEDDDQEIDEPQSDINPIRRSIRTRHPTDRMCLYIDAKEHKLGDLGELANYKAALLDPEFDKWLNAMNVEMQSMKDNKVWDLVEFPHIDKTVGSKWLFKKKTDMDGAVHTYKACLKAKGYTQTPGINYEETFSPVADIKAIRILIAIAAFYDYEIRQMDVKTSFLNGYLFEEVYMEQAQDLDETAYILGIKIYRDRSRRLIGLCQSAYIEKILKRYHMKNSKRGSIPMQEKLRLSKSQGASTPAELKRMQNVPFASVVDSIMYVVRCTHHDVAFAQNITSRFQHNPGDLHWTTVKNILKYLRNTKDMFLVYEGDIKRELKVSCYTDVGYLTDADDLKKFIYGLGVVPMIEESISRYCDNTRAISIANESGITKGARHFRAEVHYLSEVIEYGDVKLEKVHTYDNLADPFTKALAFSKHSEHTRNIGMLPASSLILGFWITGGSGTKKKSNVIGMSGSSVDSGFSSLSQVAGIIRDHVRGLSEGNTVNVGYVGQVAQVNVVSCDAPNATSALGDGSNPIEVGHESAIKETSTSEATKVSLMSLTETNLCNLDWLTLASVYEVSDKMKLYVDDCPKAPKRGVNKVEKGEGGSSEDDDEGFIKLKKKKSGANGGTKNFNPVLMKPKPQYRPKTLNVDDPVTVEVESGHTASTSGVQEEGISSTLLVEKIHRFEQQLLDGECMLVDEDGKLRGTYGDIEQEYDYDPYDGDMYEGQDIPDTIHNICNNLDIMVRGRSKK
uniref:Integrase catalytic domain-containing protein n=1 Tax=Tanacetum cinerariifolium TaxID=118510 RepID=A0A699HE10_TANCI|nr:hypothetical protein [Tanacetum cinerariifolium]